jgi:hypothetical protein
VEPTTEILFPWDHLIYTGEEPGPTYIPTRFCIAPGKVHGQGISELTINNKITQDDATLQSTIANTYERLNSEYGIFSIELAGKSDLGIDPAEMTWVQLGAFSSLYIPQRLLPIFSSNPRLLPLSISRRVDRSKTGDVWSITLRCEIETSTDLFAVIIDGSEM